MNNSLRTCLFLALTSVIACKSDPQEAPDAGAQPSADAGTAPTVMQAIAGLELYANNGCAACHCNTGEGGCNLDAPSVQRATFAGLDSNLRYATTPEEFPDLPDPFDPHPYKNARLTEEELANLVVFLGTLSGGTPVENETLIGRGYELYVSGTCISCHLMSAQGVNQGGLGQAIAGIDPDNLYYALAGGVPCHPLQNEVPTSSTGEPLPVCSLLGRVVADNPTVAILTDQPPPDADNERFYLSYFLAFISPPPTGGVVDPCLGRSGEICTVAGNGIGGYTGDDIRATDALLYYPQNLELTDWNADGTPDLAIDDWNNHRIRMVFLDKETEGIDSRIITIAGDGKVTGVDALNHPVDIAFDGDGNLIIATWHNQNIYRYGRTSPPGTERDQLGGLCDLRCAPDDQGPTLVGNTTLALPVGMEVHPDGSLLFSESACGRIRRMRIIGTATITQPDNCIDPVHLFAQSTVETIAGQRQMFGYEGDGGPARLAKFNPFPGPTLTNFGISLEKGPNPRRLYVADSTNNVIRYVDLGNDPPTVHLFAGTPGSAGMRDGLALEARFNFPTAVYVHTDGAVYVADNRNHAVRRIKDGQVTTIAGTGRAGFNGDNLEATKAQLAGPSGVVVHPDGRVFISDTNNNRVRVIQP
jgi:sugar lactone lactonase YvrE